MTSHVSVPTGAPRKRRPVTPQMSESALLDAVLALAKLRGWRAHHCRAALTAKGWRTPVQGDAGFVDLVLARRTAAPLQITPMRFTGGVTWVPSSPAAPGTPADLGAVRLLFVELKSDRGRVSPEQQAWLDALSPYSCVWRPADLRNGTIERALR